MKLLRRFALLPALGLLGILLAVPSASADNGAPSGAHYNLNIIGVAKNKNPDMKGDNGHRIFVPLWGTAKIWLDDGPTFNVLDANGTDADGAKFQLPNPDPDNDGVTAYSVYARALGKPGGSAVARTCFTDGMDTWCSTESVVLVRGTGPSKFVNVSKELLTLCLDGPDVDTLCDTRVGLFDDGSKDYFWQYDNTGLRLAQLRFYEIPTNVGTGV